MNKSLYDYICCPSCKSELKKSVLTVVCRLCKRSYEIRSGIPILVDFSKIPEHLQRQIQYFEHEDEARGDWTLEPWQARYVRKFLDIGKPKRGGLIIDNATGSGYMTIELAKRGYRVIATDLTLKELVKLKRAINKLGLSRKVLLVCVNSEMLPIKSAVADGLVANAILEHLPNEKAAINEITRVIKKGAPVMVAMPLSYYLLLPFLWFPNVIHDRGIGHLRRYDRESIIRKFRRFREIKTYYTGHVIKVFCLFLSLFTKMKFWEILGEKWDIKFEHIPYGGSNIVSILKKL